MPDKPLISILLPVYNALPWLNDCLDSIRQQSHAHWELLAVDDYSTDQSLDTLQHYANLDSRIKVFENKHKGIIPGLQLAFYKSKGQFITRMDADDLMAPQKLEYLSHCLSLQGNGHIITGWVKYISTGDLGNGYQRYETWLNSLCDNDRHYEDIYRECVIPSPCWMTSRDDLLACGAFDSDRYPEDYDLCFRFYQNGLNVTSVKKVIHFWRDHPGRTSRNSDTYADQQYFDLKLPWFLKVDYDVERPLVLWGTGKKGKRLARKLLKQSIPFSWVTNNNKKQEINIYGKKTTSHLHIKTLKAPQVIVAVAAPEDQKDIQLFWEHEIRGGKMWLFC